jgi:aquaporin Z
MVRKLVVELVGTFFLITTVGMAVLGGSGAGPLAVGAVLIAMVYAGGHVSGAHYNPAVTLGVFLRGRATAAELVGYWVVQIVGGLLAVLAVRTLAPDAEGLAFAAQVVPAVLAEFLFTFALVFVVLNVATSEGTKGNSYFGIAIGLTVLAGAFSIGGISGGALNPAVALAMLILELITPRSLVLLLSGELLGGVAAALIYNALHLGEGDKPTTATIEEQPGLAPQAEPGL